MTKSDNKKLEVRRKKAKIDRCILKIKIAWNKSKEGNYK